MTITSIHLTVVAVEYCHSGSGVQVIAQEIGRVGETRDSITFVMDAADQPKVGQKLDVDIYPVEESL